MAFLFYFAVLLVAAASALFGLDLMTSPLPPSRSPTQQLAGAPPTKLAQREADQKEADARQAAVDDRALSPVLPTAPGEKNVRMVYPPTNVAAAPAGKDKKPETSGSATADNSGGANRNTANDTDHNAASKSGSAKAAEAKAEPPASPAPTQATPVRQSAPPPPQASQPATPQQPNTQAVAAAPAQLEPKPALATSVGHCDIQACAAAYHSFRASDCTYQPFEGTRRVCEKPPQAARTADRAAPSRVNTRRQYDRADRQARREAELNAVAQRVKEMTSSRDDDDDEYDRPVRGRRVIVIQRGYGDRDASDVDDEDDD